MNVDKFGHHVHKRLRLSEILHLSTNHLVRSETGDFDLQSSRLRGVQEPVAQDDAVNKNYVDKKIADEIIALSNAIKADLLNEIHQLEKKIYTREHIDKIIKELQNGKATAGK